MAAPLAVSRFGNGPTLLMLHGIGSSRTAWQMQFQLLGDDFHCVAPDLPGYGDSPSNDRSGLGSFVDSVASLLDPEPVHLMGVSFGGLLSLALAQAHPHRVKSLILADATLGRATAPDRERLAWIAHRRAMAGELASRSRERAMQIAAPSASCDVIDAIASHMRRARPEGYLAVAEAIASTDAVPWLRHIAQPALVLCGQYDSVTGTDVSRTLSELLPNANFVEIADSGHAPHIERPDRFAEIVLEFHAQIAESDGQRSDLHS